MSCGVCVREGIVGCVIGGGGGGCVYSLEEAAAAGIP